MPQPKKHLIYLTGFMGSGKSTIGPILANALGFSHVDLDMLIESTSGRRIPQIFSESGEAVFREIENALLRDLSARTECVVSLGGGTLTNERNFGVVKSSGILVYLKLSTDEAFRRLRHKTDRPMLRRPEEGNVSEKEIRERVQRLLASREPQYARADITVVNDDRIGKTVDLVVRKLKPFL